MMKKMLLVTVLCSTTVAVVGMDTDDMVKEWRAKQDLPGAYLDGRGDPDGSMEERAEGNRRRRNRELAQLQAELDGAEKAAAVKQTVSEIAATAPAASPTRSYCPNLSVQIEALREIYKANPHLVGLKKRIDEYDAAHTQSLSKDSSNSPTLVIVKSYNKIDLASLEKIINKVDKSPLQMYYEDEVLHTK